MLRILHDTKYDFIKYWRTAVAATIAFIVLGVALMGYHKARTGEARQLQHRVLGRHGDSAAIPGSRRRPTPSGQPRIEAGFPGAEIAAFGVRERVPHQGAAETRCGGAAKMPPASARRSSACSSRRCRRIRRRSVGPERSERSVGAELKTKAFTAILISFVVTLIYLAFRFEWRFGVAAVVATAHDILTTMAFLAMMHLEVSLTVVAALLTVIGYSLNDTIIIFDRVRENLKKQRKESLRDVLNRSINETLPRSVLTHATVLGGDAVAPDLCRRSHSSVLVDHGVRCLHRNVQLHLRGWPDPPLDRAQVAAQHGHREQGNGTRACRRPAA